MRNDVQSYASGEQDSQIPEGGYKASDRSRLTALLLGVPLGIFGAHRFYAGKVGSGILMLCTVGGLGLWWLADCLLIATGEFRDIDGRRIVRWSESDAPHGSARPDERLAQELEGMRSQMMDLEERVDFMERLLVQARESGQLGPPR
jgi:hypothetical protein